MAPSYDLVTFITDYGLSGGFVGALHAVVDSFCPAAARIDLDHLVPPQDVLLGALRLRRAMPHTRPGVHLAVVDPGVGTSRRGLGLEAGGRAFIGPDNGILLPAAAAVGGIERAVSLARPDDRGGSRTFDGRDLFAPAAGRLLAGEDLLALGSPLEPGELVTLELPGPVELPDGAFELTVMQVDAFGNVQFAWEEPPLHRLGAAVTLVAGDREAVVPLGATFADVDEGNPLLLEDSDGCLALSVNRGRADRLFDLSPGKKVICRALGLPA